MTRNLKIASILGLAMLLLVPASSWASSPMLSGYGGPGAGNQVILGSMLLNTPGGGGSSSQGGAGGSGSALSAVQPETVSSGSRSASGTRRILARRVHSATSPGAVGDRAGTAQGSHDQTLSSQLGGSGGGDTLGLTGQDLLVVCLTLVALTCTAALTRRLAREPR